MKVDGFYVDVAHHLHGQRRHLALGVSHGSRTVVALGPEVTLTLDKLVSHGPWLSQTHQGVVNGRVAVRVVLTHDVTDDAGALVPAAVGAVTAVVHRVDDPTVYRFEAVAHIGQGTPDDDAHRVVEVRVLDLVTNLDRLDSDVTAGHQSLTVGLVLLVGLLVVSHGVSFE